MSIPEGEQRFLAEDVRSLSGDPEALFAPGRKCGKKTFNFGSKYCTPKDVSLFKLKGEARWGGGNKNRLCSETCGSENMTGNR